MSEIQNALDSLVDKKLSEMTDEELDAHIRAIKHTGIQRQKRKAEKKPAKTAQKKRESATIAGIRRKLEAAGKSAAEIENIITNFKQAQGISK